MLISEMIQKKYEDNPYQVVSCDGSDDIYKAIASMADSNIGAVVVVENDSIIGIFTERDVMQGIHKSGVEFLNSNLKDSMITDVIIVSPQQSMDEALDLMDSNRIRHLPVVDGNQIVGLLSIRDLIAQKLDHVKSTAEFLQGQVEVGSKPLPM